MRQLATSVNTFAIFYHVLWRIGCNQSGRSKMACERVSIEAQDGACPSHVFVPEQGGIYPAVIMFMDGFGIRPALLDMARRLSESQYVVLLPDLYYRAGAYE